MVAAKASKDDQRPAANSVTPAARPSQRAFRCFPVFPGIRTGTRSGSADGGGRLRRGRGESRSQPWSPPGSRSPPRHVDKSVGTACADRSAPDASSEASPVTRRSRFRLTWVVVLLAGCASAGQTLDQSNRVAADPWFCVVYEVAGEAALPLTVALAERTERSTILPVGFEGADAPESAPETGRRPLFGRLEVRQGGQATIARLLLYDRQPESRQPPPSSPVRPSLGAASRRPESHKPSRTPRRTTRPLAVYELELPGPELSLILDELDATGAFGAQERPNGGARLLIGPSGLIPPKEWTPEPRLDDLAERVVREGRQVPAPLPPDVGQARVRAGASR